MPNIIWPTNTGDITTQIRNAIGRDVEFHYIASQEECPTCGLDPVTNTAIDSFCPVCSGVGLLIVYSGETINAHVTWDYSEALGWVSGGQLDAGDCRVQIEYTVANELIVDNMKWAIVDDRKMEKRRKILRGAPTINRILVDLKESERE